MHAVCAARYCLMLFACGPRAAASWRPMQLNLLLQQQLAAAEHELARASASRQAQQDRLGELNRLVATASSAASSSAFQAELRGYALFDALQAGTAWRPLSLTSTAVALGFGSGSEVAFELRAAMMPPPPPSATPSQTVGATIHHVELLSKGLPADDAKAVGPTDAGALAQADGLAGTDADVRADLRAHVVGTERGALVPANHGEAERGAVRGAELHPHGGPHVLEGALRGTRPPASKAPRRRPWPLAPPPSFARAAGAARQTWRVWRPARGAV